jgi:methylglutaconyl-CoA hydratase
VAAAKKLAQDLGGIATPEAVEMSIDALAARWETDEAAEGIGAFFDKRKAAWVV